MHELVHGPSIFGALLFVCPQLSLAIGNKKKRHAPLACLDLFILKLQRNGGAPFHLFEVAVPTSSKRETVRRNLWPPFSCVRVCFTILCCRWSQCSRSGEQLVWEEVHELAQLSNMTNKDPPLIAKWFDCHGYTGTLVVRDLPEV